MTTVERGAASAAWLAAGAVAFVVTWAGAVWLLVTLAAVVARRGQR